MGKKKNQEARNKINLAARKLFAQKGYSNTTTKDIADEAGCEKTLVQYYFPKKDDFMTFFLEDMLNHTDTYIEKKGLKKNNYFGNLMFIGLVHYAYLLNSENMKVLTIDIISNRFLTEVMIDMDINWATNYMKFVPDDEQDDWEDNIAMIMGGAYELIFRKMSKGKNISPRELIEKSIMLHMTAQGISTDETNKVIKNEVLNDDELNDFVQYLDEILFTDSYPVMKN